MDKQFGITFGKEFGVKFGVKFGDNEKQLLLSLNSNPGMTAQDLADNLGITKRCRETDQETPRAQRPHPTRQRQERIVGDK